MDRHCQTYDCKVDKNQMQQNETYGSEINFLIKRYGDFPIAY